MTELINDLPIINMKTIDDLKSIDTDEEKSFLHELLDVFIKSSQKRIIELQRLADLKRSDDFKSEIHALKSSALTIGATRLVQACELIEKDPDLDANLDTAIQKINSEVASVIHFILRLKSSTNTYDDYAV